MAEGEGFGLDSPSPHNSLGAIETDDADKTDEESWIGYVSGTRLAERNARTLRSVWAQEATANVMLRVPIDASRCGRYLEDSAASHQPFDLAEILRAASRIQCAVSEFTDDRNR